MPASACNSFAYENSGPENILQLGYIRTIIAVTERQRIRSIQYWQHVIKIPNLTKVLSKMK